MARIFRTLRKAAIIAAVGVTAAQGMAFADSLQSDSDGIFSNGQSGVRDLGTLAAGSHIPITVGAFVKQGGQATTFPVAVTASESSPYLSGLAPTSLSLSAYNVEGPVNVTVDAPSTGLDCGVLNNFNNNQISFSSSAARLSPSTATVTVQFKVPGPACNTAPTVAVTGVTDAASYEIGSVPSADCSVTDAEDTSPTATPSTSDPVGALSAYGLGSFTTTCSYTDGGGLSDSDSVNYSVVDTTKPTLSTPGDSTVAAIDASGAPVTFSFSATDNVAVATESCDHASGATYPLGATTVRCTATDVAGNSDNGSFVITIADQDAPSITAPADVTEEATSASGVAVTFAPTVSDNVDLNPDVSCVPASGSTFALGTTPVTCTASDAAGNSSSAGFNVTVQDTAAPTLAGMPADITLEATSPSGAVATFTTPTASDIVDASPSVSCNALSGDTFPLGITSVTCTATDASDNSSSESFTVTVEDTIAPLLGTVSNLTATTTSASGAVVTYTQPSVSDDGDASPSVVCSPASGSAFGLGTSSVVCTATDASGNQSSESFTVTVTYAWSGILQPINTDGSSVFKQGSTVPVKFQLRNGSSSITNAVGKLYAAQMSSGVAGSDLEASSTSAADSGNTFRYDAVGGQYIYNLATKQLSAGTYQLKVDLGDGVSRVVRISLKR